MEIVGNTIYVASNYKIVKLDITDISANTVVEETIITMPNDTYLNYGFSVSGDAIVYNVQNNNDTRQTYRKVGNNVPTLLYTGTECCFRPLEVNGKIYQF